MAPLVTDGAFLPDGRHVVLRTYTAALVYSFPDLDLLARLELPAQQQGEGLAITRGARRWWLWVSSEGPRQPVYRVAIPAGLVAGPAAPSDPSPGVVASPAPAPSESGADAESAADVDAGSGAERVRWWPWALGGVAVAALGGVVARRRSPRS
ncbi:MAG: hypothetical protein R2731_17745 [Nocardioides sp.]